MVFTLNHRSLNTVAPEVLICPLKRLPSDYKDSTNLAYGNKVDSWSMGVLAYELMTGHSPYQQRDEKALLFAITNTAIVFPSNISHLAKCVDFACCLNNIKILFK